jgi:hypothetical protein
MSKERRSDLVIGIILILIGGWFLAAQFNLVPGLNDIIKIEFAWPVLIVGIGIFLFVLGLIIRNPGMCIPACIVCGIGGLLYWTNSTENWADWSYLWAFIPGFIGIGIILSTLLGGREKNGFIDGLRLILISAILLGIFFMIFSGQTQFIKFWPVLIILGGLWILIQTIFKKK